MKTPKILFLFLCVLLFTSCGTFKRMKVMKSGSTSISNFVDSVPFELIKNIPFVNVKIAGKEYRFLFDTGAPSVISTEIYEQLGLKKITASKITDSSGIKNKQIYSTVDQIEIGNTTFKDIGLVVMDLNTSEAFKCLDFDGIIGANLMRTVIWEIDYQKSILTFSDDLKNLNTTGEEYVLNFSPVLTGTPHFDITVDSTTVKGVTFDTGSSGYLTLPAKHFKGQYTNSENRRSGYGIASYGAYGAAAMDTSFYVKTKEISLGTVKETNKIIELENINKEILGNQFLMNYRVIMNWDEEKISLYPTLDNRGKNENEDIFGFTRMIVNKKVSIGYINIDSPADKAGLKIGDEIVEIAGQRTTHLSSDQTCDLWFTSYDDLDKISLIVLRNGKEMSFSIEKKPLF